MRISALFVLLFALVSCNHDSSNTIIVGTISGPESALVVVAQKVAKERYDLPVKIIEFSDYNLPNEALQDGSLDVNVYQHLPYLEAAKDAHGYDDLEAIGKTFVYPMAIYSKKFKSLSDIPDKSLIALPNDPSNEGRALVLLEKAGLVKLKEDKNETITDIIDNPKKLRFKEIDAAQLPRVLPDVAAAIINTTFALPAGLSLSKNSLFVEGKDSPYANIIVIRRDSDKKKQLELFVKAMNSDEVKNKAKEMFGEAAIPVW